MKSQKGVTLMGLIMYVIAFAIIAGIVGTITSFFYSNTQTMDDTASSLGEFNKFNLELVREAKLEGNKIYSISEDLSRVVFTSGTVFTFIQNDKSVYKDRIKICNNVTDCIFNRSYQEEKEILSAYLEFDNLSRTVEYVMQGNGKQGNGNTEENYTNPSTKQYIQNGLVLHYDGINNTGDGHSNTTDVWRDLSRNHNDGIANGSNLWNENRIVFDGNNEWVNCDKQNHEQITLSVVFEADNLQTNEYDLLCNYQNGGYGIGINNKKLEFKVYIQGISNPITISSNSDITSNTKYHIVGTYDKTFLRLYINGNLVKTQEQPGEIKMTNNNTVMAIGMNPLGNQFERNQFFGKIYSAAIYDRAINSEEILQNYKIDNERYGIEN